MNSFQMHRTDSTSMRSEMNSFPINSSSVKWTLFIHSPAMYLIHIPCKISTSSSSRQFENSLTF